MKRIIIALCILALILSAMACRDGGGGGGWQPTQGSPGDAIRQTQQYGADQWHAQLTAEAGEPQP